MKEIVFKTVVGIVLTATWGFCIAAIKKAHKRQKATEEGLKAQGADIEKALKAYEDRGYTAANAREELVADSMFDIFDRKTIQRLIGRMGTKDASTVAKAIDKVVSGLRDAFNQYADRYTDTREIVKLRGDIEKMEQIRSTFFKELRVASENFKNGVETSAEKQVQRFATMRKAFKLGEYTDKQIQNWKQSERIVLFTGEEGQIDAFVKDALENKAGKKKLYFGIISDGVAAKIKADTGLDVENFNCAISAYDIQKSFKDHGDNAKEKQRGQRALTIADIKDIPDIMANADSLKLSDKDYMGKPAIEFTKTYYDSKTNSQEKKNVIAVVSDKHMDLFVKTEYVNIKKRKYPHCVN